MCGNPLSAGSGSAGSGSAADDGAGGTRARLAAERTQLTRLFLPPVGLPRNPRLRFPHAFTPSGRLSRRHSAPTAPSAAAAPDDAADNANFDLCRGAAWCTYRMLRQPNVFGFVADERSADCLLWFADHVGQDGRADGPIPPDRPDEDYPGDHAAMAHAAMAERLAELGEENSAKDATSGPVLQQTEETLLGLEKLHPVPAALMAAGLSSEFIYSSEFCADLTVCRPA